MEETTRLRAVPLRYRCDHCPEPAEAIFEGFYLCGDCFLSETEQRYQPARSSRNRTGVRDSDAHQDSSAH